MKTKYLSPLQQSPKKAFHHESVSQSPPVKGSSKKVNPKEIAELISRYGDAPGQEHLDYVRNNR